MSRTIIRISEIPVPGNPIREFHLEAWPPGAHYPNAHANNTQLLIHPSQGPFGVYQNTPLGQATPAVVLSTGNGLMAELARNVEVDSAINAVATHPARQGLRPIFFEIACDFAEQFPWETLYLHPPADFSACRTPSPVGRLAGSTRALDTRTLDQTSLTAKPELRLLAVLAAQGISSIPEFDELHGAKTRGNKSGRFAVNMEAFVSDKTDKQHALQSLQPNEVHDLTCKQDLLDRLRDFQPHILHFFCHGSTAGSPHLQLATTSSRLGLGQPVTLSASDITNQVQQYSLNPWMTVLNCCSGAAPSGAAAASQSFARSLAGPEVPVVVGMAEPIDHLTAHSFCKAFYTNVIDLLLRNFPNLPGSGSAAGPRVTVEWVETLTPTRRSVLEDRVGGGSSYSVALASDRKWWCMPVLYTVEGAFQLAVSNLTGATAVAARVQEQAAAALAGVPGLPTALLRDLRRLAG
jgi:hypothetical protein